MNRLACLGALALLGCGDGGGSSSGAPAVPTMANSYVTGNGIRFWWNGPSAEVPEPGDARLKIDALYAAWVKAGTETPGPMMVHYPHTQLVLATPIILAPSAWVGSETYAILDGVIHVAMEGIWTEPSSGTLYEGLDILLHAWTDLCGLLP